MKEIQNYSKFTVRFTRRVQVSHIYCRTFTHMYFWLFIASCRDPGSPQNGRKDTVVRNGYTEDDSINFLCNTGYHMIGSKTITCERHNADWSHDIPQCKRKLLISSVIYFWFYNWWHLLMSGKRRNGHVEMEITFFRLAFLSVHYTALLRCIEYCFSKPKNRLQE